MWMRQTRMNQGREEVFHEPYRVDLGRTIQDGLPWMASGAPRNTTLPPCICLHRAGIKPLRNYQS